MCSNKILKTFYVFLDWYLVTVILKHFAVSITKLLSTFSTCLRKVKLFKVFCSMLLYWIIRQSYVSNLIPRTREKVALLPFLAYLLAKIWDEQMSFVYWGKLGAPLIHFLGAVAPLGLAMSVRLSFRWHFWNMSSKLQY